MCGICGMVGDSDEATLFRMRAALRHRGPDAAGSVCLAEERVRLGHTRLKIIDLSPQADQPMKTEDGDLWVVFNGEIVNFRDLRSTLENRGHVFRTRSDTEVILHAYQEWGADGFTRLKGMFSVGLVDRSRRRLWLVRDQLGIKPLYYHRQRNGRFLFASEIKALLAAGYSPDVNWQAIHDYFTFLYVPCPDTAFQGIFQVPPAHRLELDLDTGSFRLERYWGALSLGNGRRRHSRASYAADVARCRELVFKSVERQMVSDVPLGLFLSGGVDSAILAGVMSECSTKPISTYTAVFDAPGDASYDEREGARSVARHFGTDHREVVIDLAGPDELLLVGDQFDQPFGNPTYYLMHLICREARSELTVALCGAGGDEIYAGYPRHRAIGAAGVLRTVPDAVLAGAGWLIDVFGRGLGTRARRRYRKLVDGAREPDLERQLLRWTYFLSEEEKAALLTPRPGVLASDRIIGTHLRHDGLGDLGNRVLDLELQTFLPDNVLEYTDKMSMGVALEVRVPYLDPEIVEHSLSTPFSSKLNRRGSKAMLKDAFNDLLPVGHGRLPKKGFNLPLAEWMRGGLDRYFDRYMTRESVRQSGCLDWDHLQQLRHWHRTGRRDTSHELFGVIVFDRWLRRHILQDTTGMDLG